MAGGCSCARLTCVFLILLIVVGGGGFGTYFALKNRGDLSAANIDNNDEPASQETAKMVGANKNIANESITRVERFYGMSYSPYGLGDNRLCPPWDDVGYQCLLSNQVLADVRQISTMTKRLKTYSLLCEIATDKMLSYCAQNGIEVMLGVWFSKSSKSNKAEMQRLRTILENHSKTGVIKHILLGNEAIFIRQARIKDLAAGVREVRSMLKEFGLNAVKIGTAEIYNVWVGQETEEIDGDERTVKKGLDMTPVVKELDWIGLNTHPYYGGVDPSTGGSGQYVRAEAEAVEKHWKAYNIPVIITETGFPTGGNARTTNAGTARPSVKALELFAAQIEEISRKSNLPVYYFEPYDGDWKRRWEKFTEADYTWGLHTCDRKLKNIKLPPAGAL